MLVRPRILLDDVFQEAYSSKDLKGLAVEHQIESFKEGETVILTLKDKGGC